MKTIADWGFRQVNESEPQAPDNPKLGNIEKEKPTKVRIPYAHTIFHSSVGHLRAQKVPMLPRPSSWTGDSLACCPSLKLTLASSSGDLATEEGP